MDRRTKAWILTWDEKVSLTLNIKGYLLYEKRNKKPSSSENYIWIEIRN